jgi:DNA-binding HxlR family transcriptional regulator
MDPGRLLDATARVGDRWSLPIVAVLLDGPRRFNDLLDALPGLAPNILSRRLKQLAADGVLVARPYQNRPVRVHYELTAAGAALAPAAEALALWAGDRAGDGGGEPADDELRFA